MSLPKGVVEVLRSGVFAATLLSISCSPNNLQNMDGENSIVLIVDPFSIDRKFTYLSGGTIEFSDSAFMSYIDDRLEITDIFPDNHRRDTIVIRSKRKYVELKYHYNISNRYVLLATGDTVLISFNDRKEPVMISSRDDRLSDLYNFYTTVSDKRFNYDLFAPEAAASLPVSIAQTIHEQLPTREFRQCALWLEYIHPDTLKKAVDDFFRSYREKMDMIDADSAYKEWLDYQLSISIGELNDSLVYLSISDANICYLSYHHFLQRYYLIYCKTKNIPLPTAINGIYEESMGHRSHRMMFDTLLCDRTLPPKTKLALMRHSLDRMYDEKYPDYEECKQRYIDLGGDDLFRMDKPSFGQIDFNSLELLDERGHTRTFDALLKANIGRVIVVDFWSTTCTPCIESMESAAELRRKFKGRDITFIYISTWDNRETWCNKWRSIIGNEVNYESYFATNYKESKMIKQLHIDNIPRCLIFDRQGELADDDAPTPQNPNIYSLINSLLVCE